MTQHIEEARKIVVQLGGFPDARHGWIISTASWGLLPMNAALWIVYARNHMKWRKP